MLYTPLEPRFLGRNYKIRLLEQQVSTDGARGVEGWTTALQACTLDSCHASLNPFHSMRHHQVLDRDNEIKYLQYQLDKAQLAAQLKATNIQAAEALIKALQVGGLAKGCRARLF